MLMATPKLSGSGVLYRLTETEAVQVDESMQHYFRDLKQQLTMAPVLALPSFWRGIHPGHGCQQIWYRSNTVPGSGRRGASMLPSNDQGREEVQHD